MMRLIKNISYMTDSLIFKDIFLCTSSLSVDHQLYQIYVNASIFRSHYLHNALNHPMPSSGADHRGLTHFAPERNNHPRHQRVIGDRLPFAGA
jgi:hypothetical protein